MEAGRSGRLGSGFGFLQRIRAFGRTHGNAVGNQKNVAALSKPAPCSRAIARRIAIAGRLPGFRHDVDLQRIQQGQQGLAIIGHRRDGVGIVGIGQQRELAVTASRAGGRRS